MRYFNTDGPIRPGDHYHVPPLDRVDLDELLGMVRDLRYFGLHAPPQTGKTSVLLALRDRLNASGVYRSVYVDVEPARAAREDIGKAMRVLLSRLASEEEATLHSRVLADVWPGALELAGPLGALGRALSRWSMADPRPLVLLIDEVGALEGLPLLSMLRQLRAGFHARPDHAPQSVVLCGMRDVRDYRVQPAGEDEPLPGGSPFSVYAASLRLGDLGESETRALLAQHTEDTGQAFTDDALAAVWIRTAGQPGLVNALCREACFESPTARDRSRAITEADILGAQESLIRAPAPHLDCLAAKLQDDRVRRAVAPILTGAKATGSWYERGRDVEYARDLGLLPPGDSTRFTNPIYAEVMRRELAVAQDDFEA